MQTGPAQAEAAVLLILSPTLCQNIELILAGGDGCDASGVVLGGKIRRLQLRLDDDLPPAAENMVWSAAATE